jgi:hypothetical protein
MGLDGKIGEGRGLQRCFLIFMLCLSAALLIPQTTVSGDTIILKNGRKVVGRIISETKTEIIIERGSIRGAIPRKDIETIEYDSARQDGEKGKEDTGKLLKEAGELYEAGCYKEAAQVYERLRSGGETSATVERMARLCGALSTAEDSLKKMVLDEAKKAARAALVIDAENECAKKVLAGVERYDNILAEKGSLPGKFMVKKTRHFLIYHHQPYLADKVARKAEEDLGYLLKALLYDGCSKPALKKKFKIRIYRDKKEYEQETGDLGKLFHSMTTSKTEIATYQATALGDLRHELTHLLVHIILPSMPVWVHEGLATGGYERAKTATYSAARAYLEKKKFLPFDEFLKIRTPDKMKMSIGNFYMQSRMAVEFLVFCKGGMEKFHRFAKRSREIMVRDVNAYARTLKQRKVTVRNIDWIEKPMREMLVEVYGYANLKDFDADLKWYIEHREKEAKHQEQQQAKEITAEWKYTLRLDSKHFALFTTCEKKTVEPVLELAEKLYEKFWIEFADTGMFMPGKAKIYVFAKLSEYGDFLKSKGTQVRQGKDLIPHFNPWAGAVCVFKEKQSRDYLHQTSAHEIAHALSVSLMRALRGTGTWVVEGIAHYAGLSIYSKTEKIVFGEIHETKKSEMTGYLKRMIKRKEVLGLKQFINLSSNGLRQDFVARNVQCWSLFHFLQHGENGKYKYGFHRYLNEICVGRKGDADAFEKCVGKLSEIEPAYLKYIKKLKADTKTR